ncbi:hypothetical protein ACS0TY_005486 [Phlomoides rotata]
MHDAFHNLRDDGAVTSISAANIYGLDVLAHDIQDDSDDVTQFIMLARERFIHGNDKPFKIERRPLQKRPLQTLDESAIGFPK